MFPVHVYRFGHLKKFLAPVVNINNRKLEENTHNDCNYPRKWSKRRKLLWNCG